ncbi:hypothetical protein BR93DRAFT_408882 [Coniochaeta sp. PMI_546]|nr:hypothetical protein BR93DRAFT_408882 [Coniochaeta sp. PMI_546]
MTISPESKQAPHEASVDGYITCNIGSEMHVVAISQEETACFAGVLNRANQTNKPKKGIAGMLQRRGVNIGHGLVFLSITLVCLVLGMIGFFMSAAVGIQSAVSKHATPTAGTMGARALLDSSVTPFETATQSLGATGAINGTLSLASASNTVSNTANALWNSTTCTTGSSTVTSTSSATVTITISTTTFTAAAGTFSSSTSDEGNFSSTETLTLANGTSTVFVTASVAASFTSMSTFDTERTMESTSSAFGSASSVSAESTAEGVSGSLSSTSTETTCGGATTVFITYTVVPATTSPSSSTVVSWTSIATMTVSMTEVKTLTVATTPVVSAPSLRSSSATSVLGSGAATSGTSTTTAVKTATIATTVSSTATLFVTLETTAQTLTTLVTTTVESTATSSVTTPSSTSLTPYSILSANTGANFTSLTTVTQLPATTVTVGGSISVEEFSTATLHDTPIGQSSSSALATAWNSTLVTTVGPTASAHGGNATWGSSGHPMPRPTSTGSVPVSAGWKGVYLAEDGWDILRYIPMLAVGLLLM